jgi:hypothetical protein
MTERTGKPAQNQDEWQQDLNPQPMAGINHGLQGTHPEKAAETATAYEIKDLHRRMTDYTNDELKQIVILPTGSRLEQGAKYIDLQRPEQGEFTAMGNMTTTKENWYVPKTEIDYQLWNRLSGVQNPERIVDNTEENINA